MSRINLKYFTLSWWQLALLLVFVWFLSVLWPIKGLLLPSNWWGQSLIVVLNDNEARPCGGFATAYGVLNLPLVSLNVGNSYELEMDLGAAPEPLDQVSDRLYFWDLGITSDLSTCAQEFAQGYRANTDQDIDRVILVQMSFLEQWAKSLGKEAFFANVSRQVANVDRHDEASLDQRKSPAAQELKSLMGQSLIQFWKWRQISQLLQTGIYNGPLFVSSLSPHQAPDSQDFVIQEWNLGGGKSSRYLARNLKITATEIAPNKWYFHLNLNIEHLGTQDEPLSQTWQGRIEIIPPDFLGGKKEKVLTVSELSPGSVFEKDFYYEYQGSLDQLSLFSPLGQSLNTRIAIRLFPQQTMLSSDLNVRENIGTFVGTNNGLRQVFSWAKTPDENPPFLTMHQPIDANVLAESVREELNWEEGDLITEIHFNELVNLTSDFGATVIDRDFEKPEIKQNPILSGHILLPDQKTLILKFEVEEFQKNERFYLTLRGVEDSFGNEIKAVQRTLITR